MKLRLAVCSMIFVGGCSTTPYIVSPDNGAGGAGPAAPGAGGQAGASAAGNGDTAGGMTLSAANAYLWQVRGEMEAKAVENSRVQTWGNGAVLLGSTLALGGALFEGSTDLILGSGALAGLGVAMPQVYAPEKLRSIYFAGVTALDCVRKISLPAEGALQALAKHARELDHLQTTALPALSDKLKEAQAYRGASTNEVEKGKLDKAIERAQKRFRAGAATVSGAAELTGMEQPLAAEVRLAVDDIRNKVNTKLSDNQTTATAVLAASHGIVQVGLGGVPEAAAAAQSLVASMAVKPETPDPTARAALSSPRKPTADNLIQELEHAGTLVAAGAAYLHKPLLAMKHAAKNAVTECQLDPNVPGAVTLTSEPSGDLELAPDGSSRFVVKGGKGPYIAEFIGTPPANVEIAPAVSDAAFTVRATKAKADTPFTILVRDYTSGATLNIAGKVAGKSK